MSAIELAKKCGAITGLHHEVTDLSGEMIYFTQDELRAFYEAAKQEGMDESDTAIALYQEDVARIWALMPELRNTDAQYEIHEAVQEKIERAVQQGRDEMQLEYSKQEPVFWIDPSDIKLFENNIFESGSVYVTKSSFDGNTVALVIRPLPPTPTTDG